MKSKNCSNKYGFTLLELLIVVLIIGILASIALPRYQIAVDKAKFVQLKIAANALKNAEIRYMLDNDERTLDLSVLDIEIEGGSYYKSITENDRVAFDWGYCGVTNNEARNGVFCALLHPRVLYVTFFISNRITCCVPESNERGKKLCQAEFPNAIETETDHYCGEGATLYTNID